jgi:hypothetical protein
MAFADRGIDPEEITPRENVLTFRAWKAVGRQVAKGATGVSVTTWIPCKESKRQAKDGEEPKQKLRPKTARLFHISQTIASGAPKGTRPDAWQNPELVKAGTYDPECPENCTETPGEVFGEPAVVFKRDDGHAVGYRRPVLINENGVEESVVAECAGETPACTCPMAGVVTNVDCPIHGKGVRG